MSMIIKAVKSIAA